MSPLPPSSRFYAVHERGRMECPRCAQLLRWGMSKGNQRRWGDWNALSGVLTCRRCHTKYVIGVVAWPIELGFSSRWPQQPEDQRGTIRELVEARQQAGGFWMRDRRVSPTAHVNFFIEEGCSCAPLAWRESCAVHGQAGRIVLDDEQE